MEFGIVIGILIATRKDPVLMGAALLVVQPVDQFGNKRGRPIIVADPLQVAGEGDVILFVHSPDASMAFGDDVWAPVDAAVVGLVDHADVGYEVTLRTGERVYWQGDRHSRLHH
ncbi:MAG: EutN/CcmL family microcompartment protein [Anaerolineae bacterium]|nr:EutN/CcmL family microcompartment protein [Anaerolineae bacterium]